MFRFGGQHVTVNATMLGANITLAPSFPGRQPCQYTANGQPLQPDADQVAKGCALINAPDASQQQQAVRDAQGTDLVLGPNQPMRSVAPEGIQASVLNADQQAKVLDLMGEDVDLLNEQNAAARMAEIRSALADTYFAWYGPTADGSASYYRVQGPAVWIEFAPQAGGGSGRGGLGPGGALTLDHVHPMDRDRTDEYGARCSGQYIDLAPPSPRQDEAAWDRGTGRHT